MYAVPERRLDYVGLNHQVLVDEVGWVGVVGVDAAHQGGGQVHLIWPFQVEKPLHGGLIGQVKLSVGSGDDLGWRCALGQQVPHDGGTHHAAVAGDVDLLLGVQSHEARLLCRGAAGLAVAPCGTRQRKAD